MWDRHHNRIRTKGRLRSRARIRLWCLSPILRHAADDGVEDATVSVVVHFHRGVDPTYGLELDAAPVFPCRDDRDLLPRSDVVTDLDVETLRAIQFEGVGALAVVEAEGENSHPYQVRAVNPFEALRDHRPHSQQEGALVPLWSPWILGGSPLLSVSTKPFSYPPFLIAVALFGPTLAMNLLLLLHVFVGGFGTVQLARRLGLEGIAPAVCGALFVLARFPAMGFHSTPFGFGYAKGMGPIFVLTHRVFWPASESMPSLARLSATAWRRVSVGSILITGTSLARRELRAPRVPLSQGRVRPTTRIPGAPP